MCVYPKPKPLFFGTGSDVNRPANVSAANRSGPGWWGLKVDQKCVRLMDFSYFLQIFSLMNMLWTFGPHRSRPTRLVAEALAKLRINLVYIKTSILIYIGFDFWHEPKNKGWGYFIIFTNTVCYQIFNAICRVTGANVSVSQIKTPIVIDLTRCSISTISFLDPEKALLSFSLKELMSL